MIRRNFVLLFGFIGLLGCDKTVYINPEELADYSGSAETIPVYGTKWYDITPGFFNKRITILNNIEGQILMSQEYEDKLSGIWNGNFLEFCDQTDDDFGGSGRFSSFEKSTDGNWYASADYGNHSAFKYNLDNPTEPWEPVASFGGDGKAVINYEGELFVALLSAQKLRSETNTTIGSTISGVVSDLIEYDGKLIAAGYFTMTDNPNIKSIAQWDGTEWTTLGAGFNGFVKDLEIYDGKLIAAGDFFSTADGIMECRNIAVWDGDDWSGLGEGVNNDVNRVRANGSELILGGEFNASNNGVSSPHVIKWTGTDYEALPQGISNVIGEIAVVNGLLFVATNIDSFTQDEFLYVLR